MGDFIDPNALKNGNKLFGVEMKGTILPFAVCTIGIFVCYCLSSISQEYLYSVGFVHTSFLTLVCKLMAVLWGALGGGLFNPKAPQRLHFLVGFLSFATMWLSNQSLLWLNYPTQTLFKSAKLIPVMLGALALNKKRFHLFEYISAICLLIGLVLFTLTDAKVTPNFHEIGVCFICAALVADALIGNIQEQLFKQHGASANEMMTYSSLWAAVLSSVMCFFEGNVSDAVGFLLNKPWSQLGVFLYAFLNILGVYFILCMICLFGATLTTFTTSCRKAFTVVLSFLLYEKTFAWGYVLGGVITAVGIALNMRAAQIKREAAAAEQAGFKPVRQSPEGEEEEDAEAGGQRVGGGDELVEMHRLVDMHAGEEHSGASPALPTTPLGATRDRAAGADGALALHDYAAPAATAGVRVDTEADAAGAVGDDASGRAALASGMARALASPPSGGGGRVAPLVSGQQQPQSQQNNESAREAPQTFMTPKASPAGASHTSADMTASLRAPRPVQPSPQLQRGHSSSDMP